MVLKSIARKFMNNLLGSGDKDAYQHEQLIRKVNENVNEGIYRSKAHEGIVYANKAFAKLFGYSNVEEVVNAPVAALDDLYLEKETRASLLDMVQKHGSISNREVQFRRKDGTIFWGLENSIVCDDGQGGFYIDGTIVDISDRKASEDQIRQRNEELEKINAELDRFIYSTTHDLRAPLSSLLGLIGLAEMEDKKQQYKHHFDLMKVSVNRMDLFIQDIVNYSKNSRLGLQVVNTDLRGMVNKIFASVSYMPGAMDIEQLVFIDQQADLFTDPTRLSIILNNIIANAFKYHDLKQETPFIEVNAVITPQNATIIIKDNGKGIHAQYINNIFNMFYRATEDSHGSGLGLFIVKESVKKMEGEIKVESQPRVGTSFTITIPNAVSY